MHSVLIPWPPFSYAHPFPNHTPLIHTPYSPSHPLYTRPIPTLLSNDGQCASVYCILTQLHKAAVSVTRRHHHHLWHWTTHPCIAARVCVLACACWCVDRVGFVVRCLWCVFFMQGSNNRMDSSRHSVYSTWLLQEQDALYKTSLYMLQEAAWRPSYQRPTAT